MHEVDFRLPFKASVPITSYGYQLVNTGVIYMSTRSELDRAQTLISIAQKHYHTHVHTIISQKILFMHPMASLGFSDFLQRLDWLPIASKALNLQ